MLSIAKLEIHGVHHKSVVFAPGVPTKHSTKHKINFCCFKGKKHPGDQPHTAKSCLRIFIPSSWLLCCVATPSIWPDRAVQCHREPLMQKWSWIGTLHALGSKHENILPFQFLISILNVVFQSAYIWIIKHIYFYQEVVWNVRIRCSVVFPQAICGKAIAVFHR